MTSWPFRTEQAYEFRADQTRAAEDDNFHNYGIIVALSLSAKMFLRR